jgi:hypothetical protein
MIEVLTAHRSIKKVIKEKTIWQHLGLCLSNKKAQTIMAGGLDRLNMVHYAGARMSHAIKHNAIA